MALKDYLKGGLITLSGDPDNIKTIEPYAIGGGSKGLDYPDTQYGVSQGPLLGRRVSFDITNSQAEPTFEIGRNIPFYMRLPQEIYLLQNK